MVFVVEYNIYSIVFNLLFYCICVMENKWCMLTEILQLMERMAQLK